MVHRSSLCSSIRFHGSMRLLDQMPPFFFIKIAINCVGNVAHMRRAPVLPALARSAARAACHRQARAFRVGNTPWFRRVRWALCGCCLHRPLARKLVVAGTNAGAVLLRAWRWAEPPARLPQESQETHKPEQNPGHLSISAFCSASLRFSTTTASYGHRVPTEREGPQSG